VRLVDDATMIDLNTRFRGKTTTTDVLSFPGESTAEGNHLGDVAISVPQAQRQSQEIGSSLMTELQRLLLHGVLHCLGFDHETDEGEMERVEVALRERWIDPDAPWSLTSREPR
jgi:probable rRNA maturation factor